MSADASIARRALFGCPRRCRLALFLGALLASTSSVRAEVPPERHRLLVFFADGHEPVTTLDVPVTAEAGEVGTANLYVPGDFELTRTLERLGWTAIERSAEHGVDGGYVVSFACTCERGVWWLPQAGAELSASAGVDSVRLLDLAVAEGFRGDWHPEILASVRPDVPDTLYDTVVVRAMVDTCGRVIETAIEESELPPAFERAARAAARKWRFRAWSCDPRGLLAPETRPREAQPVLIPFSFEP